MGVPTPAARPPGGAGDHLPRLIQGGMGVAVSSWRLARAVSRAGGLGVVSGTALDVVLARRLQDGDAGGDIRRALGACPLPDVAARVLSRYFRPHGRPLGRPPGHRYLPVPRVRLRPSPADQELAVAGSFVEVWLAKDGHDGPIGINLLEKLQMATLPALYGAMLAGVDYVLMGAGIPTEIPRALDRLARHGVAQLGVAVDGAPGAYPTSFDPAAFGPAAFGPAAFGPAAFDPAASAGGAPRTLRRPKFLAIVSAQVLATYLARDERTRPDGFVVEGPTAGGHNAPPRGRLSLDEDGQPVYGSRDAADLTKVAAVGLPFWVAGSAGTPAGVRAAREAGAAGVQVGTLFALCAESGLTDAVRRELLERLRRGTLRVRTDARASSTGFPFKVASLPGTLSEAGVYAERPRLCDLGYLRVPYLRAGGGYGYRCRAEPVEVYLRKGGALPDTVGRACLCNALLANVGLGQTRRDGYAEPPLVTLGSDLQGARELLERFPDGWSAQDAVAWLLDAA